jgi:glutaminase
VSGALVLVVPGLMGIGLWSPPLDSLGNTVRGVHFSEVSTVCRGGSVLIVEKVHSSFLREFITQR